MNLKTTEPSNWGGLESLPVKRRNRCGHTHSCLSSQFPLHGWINLCLPSQILTLISQNKTSGSILTKAQLFNQDENKTIKQKNNLRLSVQTAASFLHFSACLAVRREKVFKISKSNLEGFRDTFLLKLEKRTASWVLRLHGMELPVISLYSLSDKCPIISVLQGRLTDCFFIQDIKTHYMLEEFPKVLRMCFKFTWASNRSCSVQNSSARVWSRHSASLLLLLSAMDRKILKTCVKAGTGALFRGLTKHLPVYLLFRLSSLLPSKTSLDFTPTV